MALSICNTDIQTISIVDDNMSAREMYELPLEELDVIPYLADGPIPSLSIFVQETVKKSQAAICDHHLRVGSYANFDGAELVANCYQQHFPAILCTRFEDANVVEMRRFRKHIPVLIKPNQLHPDVITRGIEKCLEEFKDKFQPSRKTWRSLVRVEDIDINPQLDNCYIYLVIPSWCNDTVIKLMLTDLPGEVQKIVADGSGIRLHAQVNLGADSQSELYFDNWELT